MRGRHARHGSGVARWQPWTIIGAAEPDLACWLLFLHSVYEAPASDTSFSLTSNESSESSDALTLDGRVTRAQYGAP